MEVGDASQKACDTMIIPIAISSVFTVLFAVSTFLPCKWMVRASYSPALLLNRSLLLQSTGIPSCMPQRATHAEKAV